MWKTIIKSVDVETGEVLDSLPKTIIKRDYELVSSRIEFKKENNFNYKIITYEYRNSRQLKIDFSN